MWYNVSNSIFRWDEAKDIALVREVRLQQPYIERVGSKEAGLKWTEIANSLNALPSFKEFGQSPRDQRSVRERFNKLLGDFNAKMKKGENSPCHDDLSEIEVAMEEIQACICNSMSNKPPQTQTQSSERAKAIAIRDKAIKTWSQSKQVDSSNCSEDKSDSEESASSDSLKPRSKRKRRRGNDALEYMEMKQVTDQEIRKEEIELKKQQCEMEKQKLEL